MIIGITGNIGAGKTTLSQILSSLGIRTLNLDEVAKSMLSEEDVREEIRKAFGKKVFERGKISRRKLASLVFSNKRELVKLENIIHPRLIDKIVKLKGSSEMVFVEAAVLFEAGWESLFDAIVLVYAHKAQRILRAAQRFGISGALLRDSFQLSYSVKIGRADFLICNTETPLHLKVQAQQLIREVENVGI